MNQNFRIFELHEAIIIQKQCSFINQYGSLETVYFVKLEAKGICEEIMTDTYGRTLNSEEKYFWGKYLQRYDQGSPIKSS